jgi:hypothetical protein
MECEVWWRCGGRGGVKMQVPLSPYQLRRRNSMIAAHKVGVPSLSLNTAIDGDGEDEGDDEGSPRDETRRDSEARSITVDDDSSPRPMHLGSPMLAAEPSQFQESAEVTQRSDASSVMKPMLPSAMALAPDSDQPMSPVTKSVTFFPRRKSIVVVVSDPPIELRGMTNVFAQGVPEHREVYRRQGVSLGRTGALPYCKDWFKEWVKLEGEEADIDFEHFVIKKSQEMPMTRDKPYRWRNRWLTQFYSEMEDEITNQEFVDEFEAKQGHFDAIEAEEARVKKEAERAERRRLGLPDTPPFMTPEEKVAAAKEAKLAAKKAKAEAEKKALEDAKAAEVAAAQEAEEQAAAAAAAVALVPPLKKWGSDMEFESAPPTERNTPKRPPSLTASARELIFLSDGLTDTRYEAQTKNRYTDESFVDADPPPTVPPTPRDEDENEEYDENGNPKPKEPEVDPRGPTPRDGRPWGTVSFQDRRAVVFFPNREELPPTPRRPRPLSTEKRAMAELLKRDPAMEAESILAEVAKTRLERIRALNEFEDSKKGSKLSNLVDRMMHDPFSQTQTVAEDDDEFNHGDDQAGVGEHVHAMDGAELADAAQPAMLDAAGSAGEEPTSAVQDGVAAVAVAPPAAALDNTATNPNPKPKPKKVFTSSRQTSFRFDKIDPWSWQDQINALAGKEAELAMLVRMSWLRLRQTFRHVAVASLPSLLDAPVPPFPFNIGTCVEHTPQPIFLRCVSSV